MVAADQFGLTFDDFEARKPEGGAKVPLDRCCDYHEVLLVIAENERIARRDAEIKAKLTTGGR